MIESASNTSRRRRQVWLACMRQRDACWVGEVTLKGSRIVSEPAPCGQKRRIAYHCWVCWSACSPMLELHTRQQLPHGQTLRLLWGWTHNLRTALSCSRASIRESLNWVTASWHRQTHRETERWTERLADSSNNTCSSSSSSVVVVVIRVVVLTGQQARQSSAVVKLLLLADCDVLLINSATARPYTQTDTRHSSA